MLANLNTVCVMVPVVIGTTTTRSEDNPSVSKRMVCSGLVGIQTVSQVLSRLVTCFSISVVYWSSHGRRNLGKPRIRVANPAAGRIPSVNFCHAHLRFVSRSPTGNLHEDACHQPQLGAQARLPVRGAKESYSVSHVHTYHLDAI